MIYAILSDTAGLSSANGDFCELGIGWKETQRREIAEQGARLRAAIPTAK